MQLLVPLVSSFRYEGAEVNMTLAKSEAKNLHEKISEKCCNDDEIIRILTTRSKAQLNATLNHYNNQYGNAINKVNSCSNEECFNIYIEYESKQYINPIVYHLVKDSILSSGTIRPLVSSST